MSENEANFSPPRKRPRLSPFTSSSSLDHIVSFTSLPCSLLHSLPPDVLPTPYMIIPLLSPSFTSSSTTISSFRLSHPSTPLFPQSDSYSCGYNCFRGIVGPFLTPSPQTPLEVCLSSTLGSTVSLLSTAKIQQLIEFSWSQGFDEVGARHYGGELLGKKKWIGAMEFAHLLNYLGVNSRVREYRSKGGRGLDSDSATDSVTDSVMDEMMRYCWDYFGAQNSENNQLKPPIYLQYIGHSVLIVGCIRVRSQSPPSRPNSPTPHVILDGAIELIIADPSNCRWCNQKNSFDNTKIAPKNVRFDKIRMERLVRGGKGRGKPYACQIIVIDPENTVRMTRGEYESGKDGEKETTIITETTPIAAKKWKVVFVK